MVREDSINRQLLERYGRSNNGRPNFRIVWSDSQTEKRFGEFDVHYGAIYLRTEKCVREVPKYPFFRQRWILEKQVYAPAPEDVKNYNWYEPVFVFESAKGEALEPVWKAIEIIVHSLFYPKLKDRKESDDQKDFEKQQEKQKQIDVMKLEEERPTAMVLSELGELIYNAGGEDGSSKSKNH